jgi:serine/threonine protein kinase
MEGPNYHALVQCDDGYILTSATGKYYITALDMSQPLYSDNKGIMFKGVDSNKLPKVIKKIYKKQTQVEKIKMEYKLMKDAMTYDKTANLVYAVDYAEEEEYFYIVTDYFNEGSLKNFINASQIEDESEIIEYFRQICFGIKILHQNNVIHRDISPDNIFVSAYCDPSYPYKHYLVIGDLGIKN